MGRKIIESYGGKSLHTISHGESFLNLIIYRFGESSLYLLDEPEAALSPTGQIHLLKRIHDLSNQRNILNSSLQRIHQSCYHIPMDAFMNLMMMV